jgi:hypothetical protein
MDFKSTYPEYTAIEEHIRRARIERSVAIAHAIAGLIDSIVRGSRRLAGAMSAGSEAEAERRAIACDPYLQRAGAAPHR